MPGIAGGKAISVEVDISLISFFQWFWGNYRQIWHRQAAAPLNIYTVTTSLAIACLHPVNEWAIKYKLQSTSKTPSKI